jgi:hypothetical protein
VARDRSCETILALLRRDIDVKETFFNVRSERTSWNCRKMQRKEQTSGTSKERDHSPDNSQKEALFLLYL